MLKRDRVAEEHGRGVNEFELQRNANENVASKSGRGYRRVNEPDCSASLE